LGYNAPEDAILPRDWDWSEPARLDAALKTLTDALRPWTVDFHVAQNDGTVKGSGTHDKTGHHCLPHDPNGKLTIAQHAGYWMRDAQGQPTRAFSHICWDGCMFPNAVMMEPQTWNQILKTMIDVRNAHGWREEKEAPEPEPAAVALTPKPRAARRRAKPAAKRPRKAVPRRKPARAIVRKTKARKTIKKSSRKRPVRARRRPVKKGRRK
jgi:hypothetical protein